jgi:hypothetical protein
VFHRITSQRIAFPPGTDATTLAVGVDESGGEVRIVVPPDEALRVLTELHSGGSPEVMVHDYDVVDWTAWWEEVEE